MSGGKGSSVRPVENEGITEPRSSEGKQHQQDQQQQQQQPDAAAPAASCRPASPVASGEHVNRQSEVFWRQMFEEIGVRKKPDPLPPKTWKDRLACAAVICLAALLVSQDLRFRFGYRCYIDYHYGFEAIDTNDSQLLKEVMFGGKPWIVLCKWPHKRSRVPDAVDRSRIELLKVLRLGKLDCSATLPSGVTFAERFRIPSTTEGLLLANGRAPRLLTPWALETKKNLLSYVERHTKLDIRTVDDNSSLGRRCLTPGNTRCLVLMREGGISTSERNNQLQQLFGTDPSVRKLKFAFLDLQKRKLNLHDAAPLDSVASADETQLVCFLNTTPRETIEELTALRRKDDVTRHSFMVSVFQGSFSDKEAVVDFARRCSLGKEGAEGFVKMQRAPSINKI
ncbi:hypothetical protein ACSSS7_000800 [Eimeria intestinalis]